MSRIHDMGGRFGDGPIPEKDDAVVFHSDWEARVMANTLACGALGAWNIDASRHSRECLRPKDYASFSYYEKWLAALANLLVDRGVLSRADYETAGHGAGNALSPKALKAADVPSAMRKVMPYTRDNAPAPRFKIGDRVRTASANPNHKHAGGHTRLPQYAMGKVGTIVMLHGAHVLPDSNAHFDGEAPEPLYGVEFTASELWGNDTGDCVVLDLWQNYLEAAT